MLDRPNIAQVDLDLPVRIKAAADANDLTSLVELLDPLPLSEALRELLHLSVDDRILVLSLVPAELAAELIEEAPAETAADLIEGLTAIRAAEIMEELDSDVQADLIGDLNAEDAEAILSEMDSDDAADVRRLVTYDDDTAGGLIRFLTHRLLAKCYGTCRVLTMISNAIEVSTPISLMKTENRLVWFLCAGF
jgi:magnesium transporter